MNISNENIKIETIKAEDMDFIQKLWADEESMLAAGGVYIIKDQDKETMFTILNKGEDINNHYIVFNDTEAVGDMTIRKFDEKKTAQLDMKILHAMRNKGYGKAALKLVLDHFFNTLGGEEIFFELWLVNYFAIHKLKEYGFEATLVMEDATIMTLSKEKYGAVNL